MQLDASGVRLDRVSGEGRRLGILLALAAVIALSVPVQAVEPIPDRKITWAVEGALREDPAVSAHLVDVETAEGIVTLEGRVNHLLAKERAEEVAALVKGVRGIVNRIDVTPEPRSDSSIRLDVNDALLWDPAVEAAQVDVEVDRAVVTLEGAVDSWAERTLAADVTKGVIGVREVHNELTVQQSGDRSDEDIAEEVRRRLTNDVGVDAALIDVSVNDGEVTLSGAVGSACETSMPMSWRCAGGRASGCERWTRSGCRIRSTFDRRSSMPGSTIPGCRPSSWMCSSRMAWQRSSAW